MTTISNLDSRLDNLDAEPPNPTKWREAYDLPSDASRKEAWKAEIEDRGDEESWLRFLAAGDGPTAETAEQELRDRGEIE